MKRRIASIVLAAIMLLSFALTGCSSGSGSAKDKIKVGFVFVGPIGDGGWTYAHNQGRLYLEKQLGVKTIYKESVSDQNADSVKVMKDMIDQGANVIFATSFGYMHYVEKVAKEYPNVKFFHCSGYKLGDNMSNYFGRIYEPRYLSGIAAGLKTKSNKIGYVGAYEIPEVIWGANAFALGVKSVNPKAEVIVNFTHTWYDPAKEADAAKALLDQGADVIAQHQDTTGPQIAAEQKGAFAIGYNTDSKTAAPKAYMTAPVWNWGPYYVQQVKNVMEGKFKSEAYFGGMKDGIVDLAPLTDLVPAEAKSKIEDAKKKILDGSLQVFAGPIKDQDGKVRIEAGKAATDKEILNMDYFIDNIKGKLK